MDRICPTRTVGGHLFRFFRNVVFVWLKIIIKRWANSVQRGQGEGKKSKKKGIKWTGEEQCLACFLFCFLGEWTTEGEDNRRSGQHEWRTAGWECGKRSVRGEREVYEEWTARRTLGGEDSHNGGHKKGQYIHLKGRF